MFTKLNKATGEATLVPSSTAELLSGAFTVPFSALIPYDSKSLSRRGLRIFSCDDLNKEAVLQHMGFINPFSTPAIDPVSIIKPEYRKTRS